MDPISLTLGLLLAALLYQMTKHLLEGLDLWRAARRRRHQAELTAWRAQRMAHARRTLPSAPPRVDGPERPPLPPRSTSTPTPTPSIHSVHEEPYQ